MKNNIASERVRLGLTQSQVAERIGTTCVTFRRWENDPDTMKAGNLKVLTKLFGCTADYLLGISDARQ